MKPTMRGHLELGRESDLRALHWTYEKRESISVEEAANPDSSEGGNKK
jgi:hypothetical protein